MSNVLNVFNGVSMQANVSNKTIPTMVVCSRSYLDALNSTLCTEERSHDGLVQGMATYCGPRETLEMQLEQVKESPIRLGTLMVHNETE